MGRLGELKFRILQLSTSMIFLGRAWQHLYWDAPFRALLWDESLMQGVVQKVFGHSWQWYVSNPAIDAGIQNLIKGVGGLYLLAALAVYIVRRYPRPAQFILFLASINLILLALLETKAHFYYPAQFFEYSLQIGTPFFFLAYLKHREWSGNLMMAMRVAIALTFVSHGLFAIGFYTRPGYFIEMTMNILKIDQGQAIQFLYIAAVLDFVVGIGLFLPRRVLKPVLIYAVFWGFCTTMARFWANFYPEMWDYTLIRWVHECLFRFPHFLIPLLLLFCLFDRKEKS